MHPPLKHLICCSALIVTSFATTSASVVNFNESNYKNGADLNTIDHWAAQKGHTIDTKGSGQLKLADGTWVNATYHEAILPNDDGEYIVSADIRFDESNASGKRELINLALLPEFRHNGGIRMSLFRLDNSKYMLVCKTDNATLHESARFNKSELGLTANKKSSDLLKITFKVNPGSHKDDWDVAFSIKNVTRGKEIAKKSVKNCSIEAIPFESVDIYGGFATARDQAQTGTNNRVIESFYIGTTEKEYVSIPEPRCYTLISALSALTYIMLRRRR